MDIDTFCSNYVDPLSKEAGKFIISSFDFGFLIHSLDNVAIEALCRALNLNVDVAYLDGSKSDAVDLIKIRHDIPTAPPITLLYR
jgi:ubiquitin thioesterase protein OTUB1